jgi:hypothetical protein
MAGNPVNGNKGSVQVFLATPASTTTQVALSASDPAIAIPLSVTIPAGSLTQNVPFTIGSSFNSSHVFWIKGTLGGSSSVTYGTRVSAKGQGVAVNIVNSSEGTFAGASTADYQLGINSVGAYETVVQLSCQGLPAGASCQFGTTALPVLRGLSGITSLYVNTTASISQGQYPFTVKASDGVVTATGKATLAVGDYSITITPSTQTVLQNTTSSYTVDVSSTVSYGGNFTGTCSGIPSPAVCTMSGQHAVWAAAIQTNTLAAGNYNFTVGLSDGVATRSASAQLNVGDFNASLSTTSLSVEVGGCTACSITPGSVTPSPNGTPATMTVAVSTKPALSSLKPRGRVAAAFFALFFATIGLLFARSSANKKPIALACLLLLALVALGPSCGGGGGGSSSFNLTLQATADGVTKNVGTVQVTVP